MTIPRRTSKEQLIDYFKKNLKKGYTPDTLKWALINQKYSRVIVENALEEAQKELAKEAPAFREKPTIKYEILDQDNKPIAVKRPWWKRLFGL